ncbi:MAG: ABC transporter permease [Acidobacteriota bacterium]
MLTNLLQDVRYGLRQLRKSPTFTVVAVISLALGIGANTAIFSLVHAVLLRSLPVPNPQELRVLKWSGADTKFGRYSGAMFGGSSGRRSGDAFSYPNFSSLRDQCRSLAEVAGYKPLTGMNVRGSRLAFIAEGSMVSDNFFSLIGVKPLLGRLLSDEDESAGAPPVAVISYALWEREFDLDPETLGRPLTVNGHIFTIVGVLPHEFSGLRPAAKTAFYVPMSTQFLAETPWSTTSADFWWVQLIARLKPETSDAQLQAALDVAFAGLAQSVMQEPKVLVEDGSRGPSYERDRYGDPLLLLLVVVGLVILVACANLAGLLLARGMARKHEFAVRAAVGAGRWRLMRQSFVESLILAAAGGGLGIALALWGKPTMARLLAGSPEGLRYETPLDLPVLGFTVGVILLATILSGLFPALQAGRVDPLSGLRGRGLGSVGRFRTVRMLVVAQITLTVLLVAGAGLFGRSLFNLVHIDTGFRLEHLLLFRLDPHSAGYEEERTGAYFDRVEDSVSSIPGVRSAAISQYALLGGWMSGGGFFALPGHPTEGKLKPQAHRLTVGESFFKTMGIPILKGRGFESSDNGDALKVVVVNRLFARKYFSGGNALGQRMTIGDVEWRIVGICADTKYTDVKADVAPTVYFSFRQEPLGSAYFAVRTALPPTSLVPAIRRRIASIDPNIPISDISTQIQLRDSNISQDRLFASLCSALAALAVLLSCMGLYGLLAYQVGRRTREIGVRMALGARPQAVARPLLKEAFFLGLCGLAVGVPAALAAGQLIRDRLYGITAGDPWVLALTCLGLLATTVISAWIPARRAAKVAPMEALRAE